MNAETEYKPLDGNAVKVSVREATNRGWKNYIKMKMKFFFLVLSSLARIYFCNAQVGLIDSTFGVNGRTTNFLWAWHIAVQTDDKILIATSHDFDAMHENDFGLCRFKSNGRVDSTFGINGRATGAGADFDAGVDCEGLALQSDGKIVVSNSGNNHDKFVIARYNTNGQLDLNFGINGFAKTSLGSWIESPVLVVQPDGKIIAGGDGHIPASGGSWSEFVLIRYNANGSIDNSFGNAGVVNTGFSRPRAFIQSLALQQDGKIVAAGYTGDTSTGGWKFALARYNSNGTLDNTFGIGGKSEPFVGSNQGDGVFSSVIVLSDNKILLGGGDYWIGGSDSYGLIMKLNVDGSFDTLFGDSGLLIADFDLFNSSGNYLSDIKLQADNKIVAVGYSAFNSGEYDFAMARYNSNGSIDSTFALNGQFVDSLNGIYPTAVALQSTGKIVTANGFVFRFLNDTFLGTLDFSEASNTLLIYPNPIQSQATLQYVLTQDEQISIELFDMQGKLVQQFFTNETRTTGKHEEVLNLNEFLPAGSYIINIGNRKNSQGVKVVKE
ncbi:hypothetical protein LBMAG27_00640 [Bacteroidota bacterium]|nr:hypothetical protein LBMAG27_00640 [Bacteroidota bacterium]